MDLPKRRYLLHPPTSILTEAHKQENIFIVFLFFSFLFFDFRSIQLRWINAWKILDANATIISSTGEYLWTVSSRIVRETFQWIFRGKIARFLLNSLFRKTKRGKLARSSTRTSIYSRFLRLDKRQKKSHFFEFVLLSKSNRTLVVLIVYKTTENKDNWTLSLLESPGSIVSIVSRS